MNANELKSMAGSSSDYIVQIPGDEDHHQETENHLDAASLFIKVENSSERKMPTKDKSSSRGKLISPRGNPFRFQMKKGGPAESGSKGFNPNFNRDGKQKPKLRGSRAKLTRHLSLGTAVSMMNKDNGKRTDVLQRSGSNLGDYSSRVDMPKENYALFRTKTKQGFDRQISLIPSCKTEEAERRDNTQQTANANLPAGRYFDALRGPELDELKDYEDILLPLDQKWPFLLRFPIGCFGICLGLSSQAILWENLSSIPWMKFLHVPAQCINIALWCLSLTALLLIFSTYTLKCIFYFEAVRREYYHPVRVNFFFAPWIVCMFLTLGVPPSIDKKTHASHRALWCVFMAPVFMLELKIYGQWLSGGKRRLSKVANPSSHLSIVGNFVGALLAAKVHWKEPAKFFWAVGLGHYVVLFVTLYQRLPTSEALPQELHPVFFLFIAAPCTASVAWEAIYGEFDGVSRLAYFIAIFLYTSLVVRLNFFRGFRFSVAWWAYTFPMTAASIATISYSKAMNSCVFTKAMVIVLSLISSTTVLTLFLTTLLHAFVWGSLFPNDIAIAITQKRNKPKGLKEVRNKRTKNFNLEHRAASIRRGMEMLRSNIKRHQARLFNRSDESLSSLSK